MPFGQDKPGMSHSTTGLIGNTTHHNTQPQQPPMYVTPQYPPTYGGSPYYHPPPYPQPYPLNFPPPTSRPLPTPTIHPTTQPSFGTPSTSTYTLNTSESSRLPTHPRDHYQRIICTFLSLGPPSPFLPHIEYHMLGLILFNPLPFSSIKILNS